MTHIFISYSHKDTEYARRLQEALIQEGFEVWIDDRIEYGDEWPIVIQERLDACDVFILIASENSYRSKWVHKEVTRAQRTEKPFFPLLLDGHPWLTIESTQYVDVRDRSLPTEKFYNKLAKYTSRNKPAPLPPPPLPVEEKLKTLESQAVRYELMKDHRKAISIWSEMKRLDPHYPGVDRKLDELEQELFRIKQKAVQKAKPVPMPAKRSGPVLQNVFAGFKTLPFLVLIGVITALLMLIGGGVWLIYKLTSPGLGSGADYPFVFSVQTGEDVNVYSYDTSSNRLSLIDMGPGKNWDPTYSELGNIYFTSNRDGKAEIYRLVNGISERVTFTPDPYESWNPALSPNGNLYFTSNQFDGKAEICRLVDKQPVRVTTTPGQSQSWGPVLSPNGIIYYTTDRDQKREVYKLVNAQPQYVTDTPGNYESWGPAISPLTGALYFTSNRGDGHAEIYRLVGDAEPDPVTDTPDGFESWAPVITADGRIYYTSTRENGKRRVYMLVNTVSESLPAIPGQAEGFTDVLNGILPVY
jgi:hypothetical protein